MRMRPYARRWSLPNRCLFRSLPILLAVACGLCRTAGAQEGVVLDPIPLDAPRIVNLRTVAPDGAGGGYTVDLRLTYDRRGRVRNLGSCVVDGEVVKAKGRLVREDGGFGYRITLRSPRGALPKFRVRIEGGFAGPASPATVTYQGPRGTLEPVVASVNVKTESVRVGAQLRPFHGLGSAVIGSGTFQRGYRGRTDASLVRGRLEGGELSFTLKSGKDRMRFSGVVQPDGTAVGVLRFRFLPARGRVETYVVPRLFDRDPPEISSVALEPGAVGDVPVTVVHTGDHGGPVTLEVEVSRDQGLTWHDARLTGSTENTVAASAARETTFLWDSVADVGIHEPRTVMLRVSGIEGGARGAGLVVETHRIDNLRVKAGRIHYQMTHYGELTPGVIAVAERHELVICHPFGGDVHREQVAEIQDGLDPDDPADDVLVLGYISVGEDLRTDAFRGGEALASDPRFVGDGTGPRVDPRGPGLEGGLLRNLPVLGDPSPHGTGFASFYLDDTYPDGVPDQNPVFGGAFTNAGDPKWFDVLEHMTFETDGMPGMLEILTTTVGRGLGLNGLFMDTFDTPAPNVFTDVSNSLNPTDYEWTGPGFPLFIRRARAAHPRALLLQNRGLFYYDPTYPHFELHAGDAVDYVFFESYRSDNNTDSHVIDDYYFSNKYDVAPKLMAEANRENGFTVISLGYAEGPPEEVRTETLIGLSNVGLASLREDIHEAHAVGFRHYIANIEVDLPNLFVMNEETFEDHDPPVWNSTFNINRGDWPQMSGPPVPRPGIQQAEAGKDHVTVRWDVALDKHRVHYDCYYQDHPFDFSAPDPLADAVVQRLKLNVGRGYSQGSAPATFPNEDVIANLTPGVDYHFLIRATDESPAANQEQNQVTLAASPIGPTWARITVDGDFTDWAAIRPSAVDFADAPDSTGPDFRQIYIANDADNLYLRIVSDNLCDFGEHFLAYVDADNDVGTGLRDPANGIVGSDILVFSNELYRQIDQFNDGFLGFFAIVPQFGTTQAEMSIPLAYIRAIRPDADRITIRFQNDAVEDYAPDGTALMYVLE